MMLSRLKKSPEELRRLSGAANRGRAEHGRRRRLLAGVLAGGLVAAPALVLAQGSAETDRAALVALHNATGGETWRNSTNWLSDAPLREWHGVGTDEQGRVVTLNLGSNGLTGSLPESLATLTELEVLFLHGNRFDGGPLPDWLGSLTNLRDLFLYNNGWTGPVPSSLANLTNLERLNLGRSFRARFALTYSN